MNLLKPPALRIGDTIGIIALSGVVEDKAAVCCIIGKYL